MHSGLWVDSRPWELDIRVVMPKLRALHGDQEILSARHSDITPPFISNLCGSTACQGDCQGVDGRKCELRLDVTSGASGRDERSEWTWRAGRADTERVTIKINGCRRLVWQMGRPLLPSSAGLSVILSIGPSVRPSFVRSSIRPLLRPFVRLSVRLSVFSPPRVTYSLQFSTVNAANIPAETSGRILTPLDSDRMFFCSLMFLIGWYIWKLL